MIGIGLNLWRRGGSGATYFDASAAGGGSGSYTNPYNDLTVLNALTGNQGGQQYLLKAGEVFEEGIVISNASNFTIGSYGTGDKPHVTQATAWVGAWTSIGSNKWTANTDNGFRAPIVNGLQAEWRDYAIGTAALALLYECNEYTTRTYPYTYTHSAGVTTLYLDDGLDPNSQTMTRSGLGSGATRWTIQLSGCSSFTLSNLMVSGGGGQNLTLHNCDDFTCNDLDSLNAGCGDPGGNGQNTYHVIGTSNADRSTNGTFNRCIARRSIQQNNNGFEFNWVDGMTLNDCVVKDVRGNSVELYESCANVTVNRMESRQSASLLKTFDPTPATTVHSNITIQNSLCIQRESYLFDISGQNGNSGAAESGFGIFLGGSTANWTNVTAVNNTFDMSDSSPWWSVANALGTGTAVGTFKNNLCIQRNLTGVRRYPMLQIGDGTAGSNAEAILVDCDYNVYQSYLNDNNNTNCYSFTIGQTVVVGDADSPGSLTALKARWATLGRAANDSHSIGAQGNVLTVAKPATLWGVANTDLKPMSTNASLNPCIGAGLLSVAPATDHLGVARSGSADIGAYQATADDFSLWTQRKVTFGATSRILNTSGAAALLNNANTSQFSCVANFSANTAGECGVLYMTNSATARVGLAIYKNSANKIQVDWRAKATTAISNVTNAGGLCRVTSTAHGLITGFTVVVAGVVGTTAANGTWTVTVIDADTVDLQGTTYNLAYVSGGTIVRSLASITSAGTYTSTEVAVMVSGTKNGNISAYLNVAGTVTELGTAVAFGSVDADWTDCTRNIIGVSSNYLRGTLGRVWLTTQTAIDFSVAANRALFYSESTGAAVPIQSTAIPWIYFGDTQVASQLDPTVMSRYTSNQGNGGCGTTNGWQCAGTVLVDF
jgi:hypothetical protein